MTPFQLSFRAARRVSTPIAHVKTPDQAMTLEAIKSAVTNGSTPPILVWDAVRGCQWGNEQGLEQCWKGILGRKTEAVPSKVGDLEELRKALTQATADLVDTLLVVDSTAIDDNSVVVILNAHLWWEKPHVVQSICNLRDSFKRDAKILALLTTQSATLPAELRDAMPLAEELPSLEELEHIVAENMELADQAEKEGAKKAKKTAAAVDASAEAKHAAVDAVCGLPAFAAEQAVAMSFVKSDGKISLDTEALWNRKKEMIEQTPGLSVWRGPDTFADLGGLANIKRFMLDVLNGENPPRVICFLDEVEKSFAGASNEEGGDSSGTTQEMHGTFLSEMQNQGYIGAIIVGPSGTGKSAFAKALAGEAKRPCIIFDLSGMKSKWVGSSNENLNAAFAVVRAVSQGNALFIATCNGVAQLPPELKRRFTLGTFFMDLPPADEKEPIWQIKLKKYGLDAKQKRPDDAGWTGADIEACCSLAWRMRKPLVYAAAFLTPVAQTDAARILRLRKESSGKYLSASYEGKYVFDRGDSADEVPAAPKKARTIRVAEQ
jgi:hypothetical protein